LLKLTEIELALDLCYNAVS